MTPPCPNPPRNPNEQVAKNQKRNGATSTSPPIPSIDRTYNTYLIPRAARRNTLRERRFSPPSDPIHANRRRRVHSPASSGIVGRPVSAPPPTHSTPPPSLILLSLRLRPPRVRRRYLRCRRCHCCCLFCRVVVIFVVLSPLSSSLRPLAPPSSRTAASASPPQSPRAAVPPSSRAQSLDAEAVDR